MTVFSATLMLLFVMDPFGNVPVFLAVLKDIDPRRRTRIILRELVAALIALLVCFLLGKHLLAALAVSQESLELAAGVVLFLLALRMIFPPPGGSLMGETPDGEPFIVPLAIPLIAGPSAMSVILIMRSREPERWLEWIAALFLAWLITSAVLLLAGSLQRVLSRRGLIAIERLMGLLLTTVAVEMMTSGIRTMFMG